MELSTISYLKDAIDSNDILRFSLLLELTDEKDVDSLHSTFNNQSLLIYLATKCQAEMISVLLGKGANPNVCDPYGWTALHFAIECDADLQIIEALLKAGASPNILPYTQNNPATAVINRNDVTALRVLLDNGMCVEGTDSHQWTLLHHACLQGKKDCMEVLLEYGADIYAKTDKGWTTLHFASASEESTAPECVRMLLERGADPNCLSQSSRTPLHLVVTSGVPLSAEVLLAHGASLDSTNKDGKTPLQEAQVSDRIALIDTFNRYKRQYKLVTVDSRSILVGG